MDRIDLSAEYNNVARERIAHEIVSPTAFMLEWPRVRKPGDSQAIQMGLFPESSNPPEQVEMDSIEILQSDRTSVS